jgi:heme exporter protein CcmD
MDWSSTHSGFVFAAYGLSAAAILVLVIWIVARDRVLRKSVQDEK